MTEAHEQEPQLGQSPLDILVDEAFMHVAGMELTDVMRSRRYQEHLERYTELFAPDSGTSLQQRAREFGVHFFGAMMSIHSDDVAAFSTYGLGKAVEEADTPTPHEAAMVATLNDAMLDRAAELMGPVARSVAARWSEYANSDQQYYALRDVYLSFQNKYWEDNNPDSDIEVELLDEFDQTIYDGREPFFPQDKPWPLMEKPNCLGMSILMTAFAREAGAKFVYINQVTAPGHMLYEVEGHQGHVMQQALEDTGLPPTKNLDWYSAVTVENFTNAYSIMQDFHHSIAVQLEDDTWIQVDPYMGTFGTFRFSDNDRMTDQANYLSYYWDSMPGLTTVNSYRSGIELVFAGVELLGERMGDKAVELEYLFGDTDTDSLTSLEFTKLILDAYAHTMDDLDEQSRIALGRHGEFTNWIHDVYHINFNVKKGESAEEAKERVIEAVKAAEARFDSDPAYRRRRLQDLIHMPLSLHRGIAVEAKQELLGTNAREPGVEVANPDYMPALMTLNHLRAWSKHGNNTQSVRLASHSSTQLLWHEAHQSEAEVDAEILDRAERALRILPTGWMHDRVALLLISREKPEKGASPDEEETSSAGESLSGNPQARARGQESGRDPA